MDTKEAVKLGWFDRVVFVVILLGCFFGLGVAFKMTVDARQDKFERERAYNKGVSDTVKLFGEKMNQERK